MPVPTLTLAQAAERYRVGIGHAHNLVAVHRASGGPGRGRRGREVSLNRAIVLMAMASWQAAIEDLTIAAFPTAVPMAAPGQINRLVAEVQNFATPDSAKTRGLMTRNLGIDPGSAWTWTTWGGQGVGRLRIAPCDAMARLNSWLLVRHAVAHGHGDLFERFPLQVDVCDEVGALVRTDDPRLHVSGAARSGKDASLTLADARQCLTFVNRMAQATGDYVARQSGVAHVSWNQTGGLSGVY